MPSRKCNPSPHIGYDAAMRCCDAHSCIEPGLYKAPVSPRQINEYRWFCLAHAQEYNRQWDYFSDMGQEEIEYFVRDAVTGHRPTWQRERVMTGGFIDYGQKLEDALEAFLRGAAFARPPRKNGIGGKEREALALLAIDGPCSLDELKQAWRRLVKQTHPDLHQGKKQYEERFKQITEAYLYLKELYCVAS